MTNVRVICRFRPFNARELAEQAALSETQKAARVEFLDDHSVKVHQTGKKELTFTFDRVFQGVCTQHDIYDLAARSTIQYVYRSFSFA